jgi:predicted permease
MLRVILDVILPVALVAAAGGIIGRWRGVPVGPLSVPVFYLFSPALVFYSLATTQLSADVSLKIVIVTLITYIAMYVAAAGWSTLAGHDRPMRAGFALAASTPNGGNMGLPVALLAFGQAGLDIAVKHFVVGAMLTNSAGVAIGSMAGGSAREALYAPLRYPSLYAAVAGIVVNVLEIDLPTTIEAPVSSLADAAVPGMLVVLGLQLLRAPGLDQPVDLAASSIGRLLIAPVVAWMACLALGLDGDTRATLVVLAAMPTAVMTIIIASEFNARPLFVTRAVVVSTLTSMVTLTLLISLVR